jgi:hypothetical protein
MVFVEGPPAQLFVYATENDFIDLKMLPKDIPLRRELEAALTVLPNNFNPGVRLKAIVMPSDKESIFVDPETFTAIIDGRRVPWNQFLKQPLLFVRHIAPVSTYQEMQKYEGYLSYKYTGSGSMLPIGHPYKNSRPLA